MREIVFWAVVVSLVHANALLIWSLLLGSWSKAVPGPPRWAGCRSFAERGSLYVSCVDGAFWVFYTAASEWLEVLRSEQTGS